MAQRTGGEITLTAWTVSLCSLLGAFNQEYCADLSRVLVVVLMPTMFFHEIRWANAGLGIINWIKFIQASGPNHHYAL